MELSGGSGKVVSLQDSLRHLQARTALLRILTASDAADPGRLAAALESWARDFGGDNSGPVTDPESRHWWSEPLPRSRLAGLTPFVGILLDAARWAAGVLNADGEAQRFLTAAKAKADLARDPRPDDPTLYRDRLIGFLDAVEAVERPSDLAKAVSTLAAIPIQVVLQPGTRRVSESPQRDIATRLPDIGRFAVKVLITIDGQPWSGTKIIEAGVLHRVHASLTVPEWPRGADSLRISYVTTMPLASFDMNDLVVSRQPGASTRYEIDVDARFNDPHVSGSEPSRLRLRAEFEIPDSDAVAAPVVGSYELDLIVSNRRQTPALERRSVIDERVAAFDERFQERIPQVQNEHRRDFDAALNALLAFQDLVYRTGLYKGRADVPEKELQEKAYEYLHARLDPDDLRQKGKRAGGEFDIEYRTVTIELKVERDEHPTEKLFEKYTRQPTQYSAADGQQLGIVFVLDVTKQSRPPGDLRNYVGFDVAPIHGFVEGTEAYSIGMAVIVSPANLRSPSDYS